MPPLHRNSPLARAIKDSGRPAYKVAAEAGIASYTVSAYCHPKDHPRYKPMTTLHKLRLASVLGVDPEDIEP